MKSPSQDRTGHAFYDAKGGVVGREFSSANTTTIYNARGQVLGRRQ